MVVYGRESDEVASKDINYRWGGDNVFTQDVGFSCLVGSGH